MARRLVAGIVSGTFDAVFRPSRFVRVDHEALRGSVWGIIAQLGTLAIVFVINLLAYALPLTLAGFGTVPNIQNTVLAPVVGTPTGTMRFFLRFAQNALYLTGAAGATFVAFHLGILVTRSSKGILPTLHTVIYSTSAYLAAIFSFVMYLDTAEQFARAADFVLWVQLTFIYWIIDAMDSDLTLQTASRPGPVPPQGLSVHGQLLVAGLVIASAYYVYSMYLGSRVNHDASRVTAVLTLVAVLSIPVLFVVGSILTVTTTGV